MHVRNSRGSSVWRTALPCASRWNHSGCAWTASSQLQVGTHARDDVDAALLGGGAAVAEEIAVAEKLALAMERHLRLDRTPGCR